MEIPCGLVVRQPEHHLRHARREFLNRDAEHLVHVHTGEFSHLVQLHFRLRAELELEHFQFERAVRDR